MALERFGEVSTRNLLESIQSSKQRPFARVLFALGIEEVGEVTGRNLAMSFRGIDALLEGVRGADRGGAGDRREDGRCRSTSSYTRERMQSLIADLRRLGLCFSEEGPLPSEGPLAGKTLVITGTLPSWSREQATEQILAAGGRVSTSVSKKTDYLVAGESAGSKLEKAERLEGAGARRSGPARVLGGVVPGGARGPSSSLVIRDGDRHVVLEGMRGFGRRCRR